MAYANKVDRNQAEIVQGLRSCGVTVRTLNKEKSGIPDLLCGFRGHNWLLEVKTQSGSLTPDEIEFFRTWNGQTTACGFGRGAASDRRIGG